MKNTLLIIAVALGILLVSKVILAGAVETQQPPTEPQQEYVIPHEVKISPEVPGSTWDKKPAQFIQSNKCLLDHLESLTTEQKHIYNYITTGQGSLLNIFCCHISNGGNKQNCLHNKLSEVRKIYNYWMFLERLIPHGGIHLPPVQESDTDAGSDIDTPEDQLKTLLSDLWDLREHIIESGHYYYNATHPTD